MINYCYTWFEGRLASVWCLCVWPHGKTWRSPRLSLPQVHVWRGIPSPRTETYIQIKISKWKKCHSPLEYLYSRLAFIKSIYCLVSLSKYPSRYYDAVGMRQKYIYVFVSSQQHHNNESLLYYFQYFCDSWNKWLGLPLTKLLHWSLVIEKFSKMIHCLSQYLLATWLTINIL